MPHNTPSIVVTGFEPFDNDSINPSWEVARALECSRLGSATVHAVQLSCVFGRAMEQLYTALQEWQPQWVLALGLAGGRNEVTIERVAINVDDARIPDNAGQQPIDLPVVPGGPAAYFSTLPIKTMVRDARAAGLACAVSNSAGTFVCNHVFYALMHRLAHQPQEHRAVGGFVHLPYLIEQAARNPGAPSMALDVQVQTVRHMLLSALHTQEDVRETAGQLH